jgi:hypothetical protein
MMVTVDLLMQTYPLQQYSICASGDVNYEECASCQTGWGGSTRRDAAATHIGGPLCYASTSQCTHPPCLNEGGWLNHTNIIIILAFSEVP